LRFAIVPKWTTSLIDIQMMITSDCKAMTKLIKGSQNVYNWEKEDVTRTCFHYMQQVIKNVSDKQV